MASILSPRKLPVLSTLSRKLPTTRQFLFFFTVFLCIIFMGAIKSSGQNLGELARQEQLRKKSLPSHASHVYTNDDLVKPRILVPEDRSDTRLVPHPEVHPEIPPEPPARPSVQATPPQFISAPLARNSENRPESSHDSSLKPIQEAPLGDIARQYRERKLARQEQALRDIHPMQSIHVYNNEDMLRPVILTPEDHMLFEARRNITSPPAGQRASELSAQPLANDSTLPKISLGDLARAYQQWEMLPEPDEPSRFPFPSTMISLASPIPLIKPASQPPKPRHIVHSSQPRRINHQSSESRNATLQMVTVMRGDSLWKLARQYLGHGSRWRSLLAGNPSIKNADYLKIGTQIRI